ncbi:MAG: ankyrin repeat domain-containing protein [bacterium]
MSAATRAQLSARMLDDGTHPAASDTLDRSSYQSPIAAGGTYAVVHGVSEHGMTHLMHAASEGSAGRVQALIDRGADIDAKRTDGFNALALAAFFGQAQVVWLLLEQGADLAPVGRSNTAPEKWADVRGFLDVGDILREARATSQLEASPGANVIDKPARFPSGLEGNLQQGDDSALDAAGSVLDEAIVIGDVEPLKSAPVTEEPTAAVIEATPPVVSNVKLEDRAEQQLTRRLRVSKPLPEIDDLPAVEAPEFHPVAAFISRMTSSRKNVGALVLAGLLVCGVLTALSLPQVRRSFARSRNNAAIDSSKSPGNSGVTAVTNVEPVQPPVAATAIPANAAASNDLQDANVKSGSTESNSSFQFADKSNDGLASSAAPREPVSRVQLQSLKSTGNRLALGNQSGARSISHSAPPADKKRVDVRSVTTQVPTNSEESLKPAPLIVESRSRSVVTTPARSGNGVLGTESVPLSITSDKPKSKVIHWP